MQGGLQVKTCFVLMANDGEYENYSAWPVRVYEIEQDALDEVRRLNPATPKPGDTRYEIEKVDFVEVCK